MEEPKPITETPQPGPKTSKLAIWSLIIAILGICLLPLLIPAIILGFIAKAKIRMSATPLKGKWLANIAIFLSIITLFFVFKLHLIVRAPAIVHYRMGEYYYNKGDYNKTIEELTRFIDLYPKDTRFFYLRGRAYNSLQGYDKAIADYTKALEIDPKLYAAYNNRGYAYYNKEAYDKAIVDYDKALAINPQFSAAYNNRGLAYGDKGDYDKAIQNFNMSLEIDSTNVFSYHNRGYFKNEKGDYEGAIADWEQAIKLDPSKEQELRPEISKAKNNTKENK